MGKMTVGGKKGFTKDDFLDTLVIETPQNIGYIHYEGMSENQLQYFDYDFTLPEGTKYVLLSYRFWGSNADADVYIFPHLNVAFFYETGHRYYTLGPQLFSNLNGSNVIYGCKGLRYDSKTRNLLANLVSPEGTRGVNFSAYA